MKKVVMGMIMFLTGLLCDTLLIVNVNLVTRNVFESLKYYEDVLFLIYIGLAIAIIGFLIALVGLFTKE